MIERLSFKKQFIIGIMIIILSSIVLTATTYMAYFVAIEKGYILPSNYYEKQIPAIEKKIIKKGIKIFQKDGKKLLEEIIPLEGMKYSVINKDKSILYGNLEKDLREYINNEDKSYTVGIINQNAVRIIPIKENKKIYGWIALNYKLKPMLKNQYLNKIIKNTELFVVLSPFFYIVITTYIFSRKIYKNMIKPINELKIAQNKIKEKDLNFTLDYNEPNELGELCVSFEDMRRELEKSINTQVKMEENKKLMVSSIAHDLKTPLTIIGGNAEIIIENNIVQKQLIEKHINIILNNVNRANKLIENVNLLYKIDSPQFTIKEEEIDIEDFVSYKYEEYKLLCDSKKIDLNMNINKHKEKVKIDIDVLSQILNNIITNSIRFTPEKGQIVLSIKVENSKINFKIEDSGKGFSKEDLKNALEAFYQGDKSRSMAKNHSGLGLYICRELLKKLGGDIKIYNGEKGGIVEFYLPLA